MRVALRGVPPRAWEGRIDAIVARLGKRNPLAVPISRFAAGPVREATNLTTLSPNVQHWWCAMASNWIIHRRNCADTVPSKMGTLGLEDGRDAELFIPLLLELRWASPLSPWSSSCVGRSL